MGRGAWKARQPLGLGENNGAVGGGEVGRDCRGHLAWAQPSGEGVWCMTIDCRKLQQMIEDSLR